MTDNLITCPKCKAPESCYTQPINEFHKAYVCLSCGFQTNDLMRKDEFNFEECEDTLPELYKDIAETDEQGRVWYPNVVNIEGKGTVFANGSSKEQWEWSAILSVPLTEEEKESPKFKGKTHKSDSKTLKNFGKDYFEACDYIKMFELK